MRTSLFRIIIIGFLAFLSGGCDPSSAVNAPLTPTHTLVQTVVSLETPEISTTPAVSTQEDEMQTNPSLPIPALPDVQALVEKARLDLAQRLFITSPEINTLEIREVFWPDASLGCPQAGRTYAQVQTPGYLIVLESNGTRFEYHANIHNRVFYCENPTPPMGETPTNGSP